MMCPAFSTNGRLIGLMSQEQRRFQADLKAGSLIIPHTIIVSAPKRLPKKDGPKNEIVLGGHDFQLQMNQA
jgi:hypothetical protein